MSANSSRVEPEGTVFEFRKRKTLCCVNLLHKAGAQNSEVSCRSHTTTAKKCTKKQAARARLLLC